MFCTLVVFGRIYISSGEEMFCDISFQGTVVSGHCTCGELSWPDTKKYLSLYGIRKLELVGRSLITKNILGRIYIETRSMLPTILFSYCNYI